MAFTPTSLSTSITTSSTDIVPNTNIVHAAVNALTAAAVDSSGVPAAVSAAAEKTLYVTPRGNDVNDGLTLRSAKVTIGAALTALAGGGTIQLGYGSFTTSASHGLSTGTKIFGAGPGLTTITYTGTGSLFGNATPGTRIYHVRLVDVALVGPGSGTTAIALDLKDISNGVFDGLNIVSFGTGIKHWSAITGGSVYNDFSRSVINSCGIGVDFQGTGSNGSRWRGVKFGACTIAVNLVDSNQNSFSDGCGFEANGTAIKLDCTAAGLSDHNSFSHCRFESNTTPWNIVSANVRDTEIVWPEIFGTWNTPTDNGTRTSITASYPTLPPIGAQRRLITRTGGYTIDAGQDVVFMNASSVTATLPSAGGVQPGRQYVVKNLHTTALTVSAAAGNIDGAASIALAQYQAVSLVSDGSNWFQVTNLPTPATAGDWTLPTAAIAQTFPRNTATANAPILASGSLFLVGIYLTAAQVVSSITFCSSTTALATGSNQWFALYSASRGLLGATSDDTSTAWAAETTKTLTLSSPYTVPTSGLYYVGVCVVATTVPSLRAVATGSRITTQAPILSGTSSTSLTNPASAPGTAASITASVSVPWAYVS